MDDSFNCSQTCPLLATYLQQDTSPMLESYSYTTTVYTVLASIVPLQQAKESQAK